MNNFKVVYESPTKWDYIFIKKHLRRRTPVWIIEPFHAYHHKKGIRFFPPPLPAFIRELIQDGKISVLKANEINAMEIYPLAADKAVDVVESVYPEYRKRFEKIFSYVSDTLKSPIAENVFKNTLCNKLAEFYSVNILLHRIERQFNSGPIVVYPDTNVYSYLFTKKLLTESNQEFFEHPDIRFPIQLYVSSFLETLKEKLIFTAKLCAQTLASWILGKIIPPLRIRKKIFSYGVTIMGQRQLRENKRGPDFIIDKRKSWQVRLFISPL